MDDPITEDALEKGRTATYAGVDKDLYSDIGFFTTWFGATELKITVLLAQFTGTHDLEAFDILCRGMDARIKVERLQQAIKRQGLIGPELHLRLAYLADKIIPLRNKLMHSAFSTAEDGGPRRYFLSGLANLPWVELKMGPPKTKLKPTVVNSVDLYANGLWLSYVLGDLGRVFTFDEGDGKPLIEIVQPKSTVPEVFRQKHQRKADRATSDTQPQMPQP